MRVFRDLDRVAFVDSGNRDIPNLKVAFGLEHLSVFEYRVEIEIYSILFTK